MPGRLSSVDRSYVGKERIGGRSLIVGPQDGTSVSPTQVLKILSTTSLSSLFVYRTIVLVLRCRIACSISVAQSYHLVKQLIT